VTRIGVFDSGIGGQSVVNAIKAALPNNEVVFLSDQKNLPYGDKTPNQMFGLVLPLLQDLESQGCKVIVIACNTVTTNVINDLRKQISVPLIGIEPMVKPAAEATKSGIVAVCATPATLASKRYKWLKSTYAKNIKIIEPDCSKWAYLIEHNTINQNAITSQINDACNMGADVIVLGCTHYHWIESMIKNAANGRAMVIQPEQAIVARLKSLLEQL
jgi:glutamate racemase